MHPSRSSSHHAPSRAIILGGTGLIGRAVAHRLATTGWEVTVTGREASRMPPELNALGVRFVSVQREDPAALASMVGSGADLVVDCVCFTADQAGLLVPLLSDIGSSVMLSSKAVYVDPQGRHMNSAQPPVFTTPVTEDTPTLPAGNGVVDSPLGYGTNKVAAEQRLLDSGYPVTVLRASKVHGVGASPAREWVLVRRILDGRRTVPLPYRGRSIDHTSAAQNIAALVETVAARPGRRIVNAADPDAPDVASIVRTVADHFDHTWDEVAYPAAAPGGGMPWRDGARFELSTAAAEALGYRPVGTYAETVPATLDWLASTADDPRWSADRADLVARYVDYTAEDHQE